MELVEEFKGTVKISVISAKELHPADRTGLSDPYCKLFVESEKSKSKKPTQVFKTKVVKETLFPVWYEDFEVEINDCREEYIRFEIFDWDKLSKDDYLGISVFPLNFVQCGRSVTYDIPLKPKGSLQIKVNAKDFGYRIHDEEAARICLDKLMKRRETIMGYWEDIKKKLHEKIMKK